MEKIKESREKRGEGIKKEERREEITLTNNIHIDTYECANATICGYGANCTNTIGSYYCNCSRGYQANGSICIGMLVRVREERDREIEREREKREREREREIETERGEFILISKKILMNALQIPQFVGQMQIVQIQMDHTFVIVQMDIK
jgi:hypothetical protein